MNNIRGRQRRVVNCLGKQARSLGARLITNGINNHAFFVQPLQRAIES